MKPDRKPDFSGYASKADVLCTDGRTIKPHAFKAQDGEKIPMYYNHGRNDPMSVLGHAYVTDRPDGTWVDAYFNDSDSGKAMKSSVKNGDFDQMSIYATDLVHSGADVTQGYIEEVSLVRRGANKGARIHNVTIEHSSGMPQELDDEAIIFSGLSLQHNDEGDENVPDENKQEENESESEETIADILDTLTPKQKQAVGFVVEEALATIPDDEDEEEDDEVEPDKKDDAEHSAKNDNTLEHSKETNMTRNVFDKNGKSNTLEHAVRPTAEQLATIVRDANKHGGSFRESFLEHATEYGFGDTIDVLFPDAKAINLQPELISRQMDWVTEIINGTYHVPHARIKTIIADITAEAARARGYIKGNLKKEEVVKLLKRSTTPTTIYKKQKFDRNDLIDITDIDVIAWIKIEMRLMINEEIARAILLGDNRPESSDDKVDEDNIRPIAKDHELYSIKVQLPTNATTEQKMEAMIRARSRMRGTGVPTLFMSLSLLTDMLLLKDKMGRRLYRTRDEVAAELLAKKVVDVEIFDDYPTIQAIYVNPTDYAVGTDKGGELTFFSDFDIDYNQEKHLLETRMSGALRKPFSALVIETEAGEEVVPLQPTFAPLTNTITIPEVEGVEYRNEAGEPVTGNVVITSDEQITAFAEDGYYFPALIVTSWNFTFQDNG